MNENEAKSSGIIGKFPLGLGALSLVSLLPASAHACGPGYEFFIVFYGGALLLIGVAIAGIAALVRSFKRYKKERLAVDPS